MRPFAAEGLIEQASFVDAISAVFEYIEKHIESHPQDHPAAKSADHPHTLLPTLPIGSRAISRALSRGSIRIPSGILKKDGVAGSGAQPITTSQVALSRSVEAVPVHERDQSGGLTVMARASAEPGVAQGAGGAILPNVSDV